MDANHNTLRKTAFSSSIDNLTNAWIRRIQKKKMPTWLKLDNSMTKLASEWVDNRPFAPREIETMLMQNLGGTTKSIMVFLKKGQKPCELPQVSPTINLKVPGKK